MALDNLKRLFLFVSPRKLYENILNGGRSGKGGDSKQLKQELKNNQNMLKSHKLQFSG